MFARIKDIDPDIWIEREASNVLREQDTMATLIEAYLDTDRGYGIFLDAVTPLCVGGDILPKLVEIKTGLAWAEAERRFSAPPQDEDY